VQTLTRTGDQRVRRNKVLAEIEGVDQRTGELDYSMAYTWNSETDRLSERRQQLLSEIRDELAAGANRSYRPNSRTESGSCAREYPRPTVSTTISAADCVDA